jgi:hypothetical protein
MPISTLPPIPIRDDDGFEHSAAAYKAKRCRCDICKAEWAATMTTYRRKKGQKPRPEGWGDQTKNHGTRSRYSSGCRCESCREANRVYGREQYAKKKLQQST